MIKVKFKAYDRVLVEYFPDDTTQKYIDDFIYDKCFTAYIISMEFVN